MLTKNIQMSNNNNKKKPLRVIAVIQVRMGSTRLPLKSLKESFGRNLTQWVHYRLSFAEELDGIVLATSDTAENDPLEVLAKKEGWECVRGSETDLISRLLGVAHTYQADAIVRVTGDCPLVDPVLVDTLVSAYRSHSDSADYITNIAPPTYPDGMDIEILPTSSLERLDREVKDPLYREWLTANIFENPESWRVYNLKNDTDLSIDMRLTVDYQEDFELFEQIIKTLHIEGQVFTLDDMLDLFTKQPELLTINKKHIDTTVVNNFRSEAFQTLKEDSDKA